MFKDFKNPTMPELINWFLVNYSELASDMKNSYHENEVFSPNPYHIEGDVFCHTMMVCQEAKNDHIVVKLSALLHDIGKPYTREVQEDTKKVRFFGHEGISFWKSIDILNSLKEQNIITLEEMNEILNIISLHGVLFDRIKDGKEQNPEKIVNIFKTKEMFNRFVKHVKNDSLGRFSSTENNYSEKLGVEIYNDETYTKYKKEITTTTSNKEINVLVGVPASGKSTFIKENFKNHTSISRDELIIEKGKELGITEYNKIFKSLSQEDHKKIDKKLLEKFNTSMKNKENLVIDMTNTSKKSRNRWISSTKNKKIAYIFITGEKVLKERNTKRYTEGKYINDNIYKNMMSSFIVPTLYEFDEVIFIH